MKHVVILGAGASADFDAHWRDGSLEVRSIPTTGEMLRFAAASGILTETKHASFLRTLQKYFGLSFTDLNKSDAWVDIESVYTRLQRDVDIVLARNDDSEAGLIEHANATFPVDELLQVIQHAIVFKMYGCGPSRTHQALSKQLVTTDTTIVSFNWDTLMEDAMAITSDWRYDTGYGVQFGEVRTDHGASGVAPLPTYPNRVLKPHGSINWYRYEFASFSNPPFTGEVIPEKELADTNLAVFTTRYRQRSHPHDLTLTLGRQFMPPLRGPIEMDIVPPGQNKLAMRPAFVNIRDQIREAIALAEKITIIGFGMKELDSDSLEVFRQGRAENGHTIPLVLINPHVDKQYAQRCHEVFAPCRITVPFKTLREYVAG